MIDTRANKTFPLAALLFCLLFSASCADVSDRANRILGTDPDSRKLKLLAVMDELSQIEIPSDPREFKVAIQKKDKIYETVAKIKNPEDLSALAMLSRAMAQHCRRAVECVEQSRLDNTYEKAFWAAVKFLARDADKNRDVLERLKNMAVLSGTEVVDWENIVDGRKFL